MEPFVTIKIKQFVKYKLDKTRKDFTTSEFIDQMLTFFEVTMTHPRDVQTYPLIEMKKEIQSLGKKISSMEKGVINTILTDIRKLGNNQSPIANFAESESKPPEITNEMIIEVATKNEQLEALLSAEKEKSARLSNELLQLNNELKKGPQCENSDIDQMRGLFNWLKNSLRKAPFNNDYIIAESAYKEFINRMENLTQNK